MSKTGPIGVMGAGAWGTALAQAMASDGSAVLLWSFEEDVAQSINADRVNATYLPGISLSPAITATSALSDLADASAILVVAPARHVGPLVSSLPDHGQPLILCSKGMEPDGCRLMNEVVEQSGWSGPVAVLSGPTFAHEVAGGLPAAVTLAAPTIDTATQLARQIARPALRPYASDDVVGAEVGGVVKNVLAVACGAVDGAGLGQNARAALISRGFAEMVRYGLARGARLETLTGLAGLGDLVLTCSSTSSRNFSFGRELALGATPETLLQNRLTVAEGALSAALLSADAKARGVEMPICDAVARLVSGDADVRSVIGELLARPLKAEGWAPRG